MNFLGSKNSLTDIPDTTAARKTASTITHISIIARISCEKVNQYNVTCYWDIYRVYQNDWSGFEVDYIHKYGEQNYKY